MDGFSTASLAVILGCKAYFFSHAKSRLKLPFKQM